MVDTLHLCTSNADKAREFSEILRRPITALSLELEEIQSLDPRVVAGRKALQAFAICGAPVMVDDTGLALDALGGFPGALVTWVLRAGGVEMLHRMLPPEASAAARVTTAIGFADAAGARVFVAAVRGEVITTPRGRHGFGFDAIFVPEGQRRTLAELGSRAKNAMSSRRLALDQMVTFLEQWH
jgi:non-canonical purine NTP pyrophosphatase (RdgB/HAM1 family)